MSDDEAVKEYFAEAEKVKGQCRALMVMNTKNEKLVYTQEKEIERLIKTQDPKRQKMYAELAAIARADIGMKDIEEYMSKRKKD